MKINNDRAAGHCHSFASSKRFPVIPVILSIDHFLYGLSTVGAKIKKMFKFFLKMHHPTLLFLALRFTVRRFQIPFEGLRLMKTLATFGIINATVSLIQNLTTIVWFR